MRTAILTREFPPDVYGGAGVHVEYLVRELRALIDVDVHPGAAIYLRGVLATQHGHSHEGDLSPLCRSARIASVVL
jgi:starch synthase